MSLTAAALPLTDHKIGDIVKVTGSLPIVGEVIVRYGLLLGNGALVSRTTYALLFAEIGFAYSPTPGADPGGNQFYLPDFTDGRNPIPRGPTSFTVRGAKGGTQTETISTAQEPSHQHSYFDRQGEDGVWNDIPGFSLNHATTQSPYGAIRIDTSLGTTGAGSGSHQNMPPVRVCGGRAIRYAT